MALAITALPCSSAQRQRGDGSILRLSDGEIPGTAHVAIRTVTNNVNDIVGTTLDFPKVECV